jgi:hypothetical protein
VHGHSKFGTFLLKTKNKIYTQWEDPHNDNAVYIGPIFKQTGDNHKCHDSQYVFVTVGTRDEPFTRLIKGVEDLVKKGVIKEKVIIQAGHSKYSSDHVEVFDFCMPEKVDELIRNAKYVIPGECGHRYQCLKYKQILRYARDYRHGNFREKRYEGGPALQA